VIEKIKLLSENPKLVEFSSFILSQSQTGGLPDYLKIDLMKIPHLVPHIFALDVLNSSEKLIVKYCGTRIDEFYGTNMTGKNVVDRYKGEESFEEVEAIFWRSIQSHKPSYTVRSVHLENEYVDKFKIAETVMFPCSSDTATVNYTIGFADYYNTDIHKNLCITLIE